KLVTAVWKLEPRGKPRMSHIGVFGETAADEWGDQERERGGEANLDPTLLRGNGALSGGLSGPVAGIMMKSAAAPQSAERAPPMAMAASAAPTTPPATDTGGAPLVHPPLRTKTAATTRR